MSSVTLVWEGHMKGVVPGRRGSVGRPLWKWTRYIEDTLGIKVHEAVSQASLLGRLKRDLLHEVALSTEPLLCIVHTPVPGAVEFPVTDPRPFGNSQFPVTDHRNGQLS
ncbi:hypothetical protein BsWGS_13394 [Bradybaena similaris]